MALTQISTQGIKDGTITGSDLATNIDLVDNQKLRLGTGNDLQIFHNGTDSFIQNYSGDFNIRGVDGKWILIQAKPNENSIICKEDGAVELYHDNSKKLETTSSGINIIGMIDTTENIDIDADNQALRIGDNQNFQLVFTGSEAIIKNVGATSPIKIKVKDGVEDAIVCNANGSVELYHDNSKKFETTSYGNASAGQVRVTSSNATTVAFSAGDVGTGFYNTGSNSIGYSANGTQTANIDSAGNYRFFDNVKAAFGTDNDLQIYHDGSHSYINNTTGTLHIRDDSVIHFASTTNEDLAKFTVNGSVELYHDNSKKFETTSIGATVFGRLDTQGLFTGDNNKILVGNSDDLQIYHDGTYNRFESGATTVLFRSNLIEFGDNSGNKYIKCIDGAATELYHNGSKKFETLSDGVDVTGTLKVNGSALSTGSTRNLIINGAMQVAQRGTSSNTAGYQTVDRFLTQINSGTLTQSQQDLATSDTPYTLGFRKYMRILNQSGIGAATNQYAQIDHKVEAQDLANSGWNYTSNTSEITLSFWVRASVTAKYFGWLLTNDGTQRNHPFVISDSNGSGTNLTANTWTKITKTFTGDSGITINNDNGIGFQISFVAYYGTDFTDNSVSTTSWNTFTSGGYSPDFPSTSWATTTNATFDITGVQLEVGSTATDFEHRSFAEEALLCKRYFQIIKGNSDLVMFGSGRASGTSNALVPVQLAVPLRASPTISSTNYSGWGTSGAHTASSTTPSVQSFNDTDNQLNMNFGSLGGALSNGRVATVSCNNGSNLVMDSEL